MPPHTNCGCNECRYPCDVCDPNAEDEDPALNCYGLVYCTVGCPLEHVCDPTKNVQIKGQCDSGFCSKEERCGHLQNLECLGPEVVDQQIKSYEKKFKIGFSLTLLLFIND